MSVKVCPRCKVRERLPNAGWCRECRTEYNRERNKSRDTNQIKGTSVTIYNRWYQMTKTSPDITLAEVIAFEEAFTGKCDACGAVIEGRNRHADHCHDTQKLRGWLCRGCNLSLGMLDHDVERLRLLIKYLTKSDASATT